MINSTYNPSKSDDFEKTKVNFDGKSASGTIAAGVTQNIDLLLADDMLMTGCWVLTSGTLGDTVSFQVVDTTGITGYPAGTILNQFITNWIMADKTDAQMDMGYPAKIMAGLTLRVIYHCVGSTSSYIAVNYKLHKVLL